MKTSVAICTYNGEKFLRQQIDSILNQTVKADEIVVCDDGSTDQTIKILNEYQEKFPDIFKIFRNEKNLRSTKNFEKAISLCENGIVFLSDQDDEWFPDKVEKIIKVFSENPEVEMVATKAFLINENSEKIDGFTVWEIPERIKKSLFEVIALHQNFITGATVAIKKGFAKNKMPFPENFHHDEWLALNASSENKLLFLPENLISYRVHHSQQVGSVSFEEKKIKSIISKIETKPENMGAKQIFSVLKKLKRKWKDLEKNQNRENEIFFQKLRSVITEKSSEIRKIASKKYFVIYQWHKLLHKI